VGPAHYAAVGIAWMIAVLTTTEVLWQNVAERKPEIALLRSLGWRDGSIRFLMLSEGILCGLMAGIVGGAVSLFWINGIYGTVPWKDLAALSASGLIPAVVGLMGAVIPSEMAVRISPLRELNGAFVTEEKAERYLGMAVALVALGCLIGMMGVLILRW
jgi:ABC-type antimicrobial peptide transport system permease subunit